MRKNIILAFIILVLASAVAFFVFKSEPSLNKNFESAPAFFKKFPFRLGLDLSGGSHLIYKADVSAVPDGQVGESMEALRDVIERRVNLFGVAEPIVQVQSGSFVAGGDEKLIVDVPGINDLKKAVKMIGQTPLLEFKVEDSNAPKEATVGPDGTVNLDISSLFTSTELTGRYLKKATLEFDPTTREPSVGLQFDETGSKLFAEITKANIGKPVAIYLDGAPISTPMVQQEITGGQAIISGDFTAEEAKTLVGRLNSGALPVPITLVSTETIGASLGAEAAAAAVKAGVIGFILLALCVYTAVLLSLFKLFHVTLTAAGIGGFIISLGMAVDANVLIFERMKEEIRKGRSIHDGIHDGFS